jgi:hypothetical protein
LQYWNKIAPAPFFKEGIGRNKYIDPYILGRIKILHKHGVMTQEKLAHIYDSNEAFNKYIQRLFRKDHIKSLEKLDQLEDKIINWPTIRDISKRLGRNIYYFHHNYNSGKINAAVSRRDFKLHIDPKDFRKILLDLRYDYKTVARRIGIKPSRLRNLNNRLRKPFFVKSISGKNCVEPYMIKRLTIYNIEGKITNKVLSHFYDKYSKLEEYMKTISGRNITYNPDNPPYFEDCLIGAAFHYDGLEGKVIGKNYDDYTPTITVRMPKRLNTYKTLNFRVRNRSIRPPEPTKELMY